VAEKTDRYRTALTAALLFHSGRVWDDEARTIWRWLTGREEATTRTLRDSIREALK
jgi:hypothetical protein